MSMALRRQQLRDFVRLLSSMSPDEQRERLGRLRPEEALMLDTAFEAWADDAQLPPADDGWRTWLMMAGRGFGKTRAGAEWIYELAWSKPVRIALVGATIDEARRVMVEGASGLLSVARRWRHKVKWEPSKGELTWPRGSTAQLYSGDNADGLRGPEHHFAWCLAAA
jgi:phage terminase large subunit-like protein